MLSLYPSKRFETFPLAKAVAKLKYADPHDPPITLVQLRTDAAGFEE